MARNKAIWIIPIFIVLILFIYIFLIMLNTHKVSIPENNVVVKISPSWNIFKYFTSQSAVFSKEKIGVGETVTITDQVKYPDNFPVEDITEVIHYLKRDDIPINISLLEVPVKGVQYSASLETIAIVNVTELLQEGNIITTTWKPSKTGFYITMTQVFTQNTAFKNFPGNQVEVVSESQITEESSENKTTNTTETEIVTQEDIKIVEEELKSLESSNLTEGEKISEISSRTGFSENKIVFTLESIEDRGISPRFLMGIIITILFLLVVILILVLMRRMKKR